MASTLIGALETTQKYFQETPFEAESRKAANFHGVESQLPNFFTKLDSGLIDKTTVLGLHNPFSKEANPQEHKVWLLDNTAHQPASANAQGSKPWQAEFVACFFEKGRGDIGKAVSAIADQIGLDGKIGVDRTALELIEERVQPFVDGIAPARTVDIAILSQTGEKHTRTLGPSDGNGISSQIELTGVSVSEDGAFVDVTSLDDVFPDLHGRCRFAGPEGWAVISDIDDTIKITQTVNPIGTLRTTFAELPRTTQGMPEFYQSLEGQLRHPAWFYLSASPYNLYPFLHKFLREQYPPGTMLLRDSSWMFFGGLLQSLTQGVQAYKVDRMHKIHSWLPRRKFVCIGDSTQSDPEAYAEIYKKYSGWIHAIYIRKVLDAPFMELKNKSERFEKAFEGVPGHVWKLFVDPHELADHVSQVIGLGSAGRHDLGLHSG